MAAAATQSERQSQRELMARKREAARDLSIPAIANIRRRRKALRDIFYFLRTYFPHRYTNPFTDDQRERITGVLHVARFGGMEALAAPRGEGKTTDAEGIAMFGVIDGILRFPLIVSATGPDAKRILSNIKYEFEVNDTLVDDFPEVCYPIRALEGAAQRANMQTVGGERTMMRWADDHIILPTVEGSKASGAIISTRGLDAAIRGVRYRATRPDFVLIDDPETRESANSELQTSNREQVIEQDIAGLGGPGKTIASVMLCTIMNRRCLAHRYTDPSQKPAWKGKRYSLLKNKPTREDLWGRYMEARQQGMSGGGDPDGREAHAFYLTNRAEMDAGALVANPERYIKTKASDGEPAEVSALQHCYNLIADRGWDNFATEYQNDPPEEEQPEESGISALVVRSRLNGRERGFVPADAPIVTLGMDLGKYLCHWTLIAWTPKPHGYVIDYGVLETVNPNDPNTGEELAIYNALKRWRDEAWTDKPLVDDNGEVRNIDIAMIDGGNWEQVVYRFVREHGEPFRLSKGYGKGHRGMAAFSPGRPSANRRIGDRWYAHHHPGKGWEWAIDVDHWKQWVHNRFLTEPTNPGAITLWGVPGEDSRDHTGFSQHITAEVHRRIFVPGKGAEERWHKLRDNNHWLDSTTLACVAGNMAGVTLMPSLAERKAKPVVTGGWKEATAAIRPQEPLAKQKPRPKRVTGGWAR